MAASPLCDRFLPRVAHHGALPLDPHWVTLVETLSRLYGLHFAIKRGRTSPRIFVLNWKSKKWKTSSWLMANKVLSNWLRWNRWGNGEFGNVWERLRRFTSRRDLFLLSLPFLMTSWQKGWVPLIDHKKVNIPNWRQSEVKKLAFPVSLIPHRNRFVPWSMNCAINYVNVLEDEVVVISWIVIGGDSRACEK